MIVSNFDVILATDPELGGTRGRNVSYKMFKSAQDARKPVGTQLGYVQLALVRCYIPTRCPRRWLSSARNLDGSQNGLKDEIGTGK
jgi:hypothetical protein